MSSLTVALWVAVPALAYLTLLWTFDRHEREPWWALLTTFAAGGLCAVLAAELELWIHGLWPYLDALRTGDPVGAAKAAFGVVAPVEEAVKLVPVLLLTRTDLLDEPVDGVVYAGATALGFAAWEGLLFAQQGGDHWTLAARAVLAMPGHLCFSGLWGAAVGAAKFWGRYRWVPPVWLAATGAHGLYDYLLMAEGGLHRGGVVAVLGLTAALTALGFRALLDASPYRVVPGHAGRCGRCGREHRAEARFCAGCGARVVAEVSSEPMLGLTPVLSAWAAASVLGGVGLWLVARGAGVGPAALLYTASRGQVSHAAAIGTVLVLACVGAGWLAGRSGTRHAPLEAALGAALAGAAGLLWLLLTAPVLLSATVWALPAGLLLAAAAGGWARDRYLGA